MRTPITRCTVETAEQPENAASVRVPVVFTTNVSA
jgi:hypothetical protein